MGDYPGKKLGVEKKVVMVQPGYKIKIKTMTYFDHLYKEIFFWMKSHGYAWKELQYGIIDFPSGGKRLELLWRGIKQADDYSKFVIDCHIAADVSDVDVKLDNGKTAKMTKGTHEFRIGGYIEKNVEVWEGKILGDMQAKLYEIMIRDRLEQQKDIFYIEAHKFIDQMKHLLKYYPEPEK